MPTEHAGVEDKMVSTTERNTSTYTYATQTYSGLIVDVPVFSWPSSILRCEPPSTTTTLGFLTRDPIGYRGSEWDLYEYCDSSPHGKTDPTGTDSYWIGGSNPFDHSTICVDKQGGGYYCCAIGGVGRGKSSGSSSCAGNRTCGSSGGGSGFLNSCSFAAAACGLFVHPVGISCNSLNALPTGQSVTTYPQPTNTDIEMERRLRADNGGVWFWNGVFSSCHTYVATR